METTDGPHGPRWGIPFSLVLTVVAILLALFVLPSPWGVIGVAGAALADLLETAILLRWNKRRRAMVGAETLVGRTAVAVTALAPSGQVRIDGELWAARAAEPVQPGVEVVVRAVAGLTLDVVEAAQP